MICVSWVTTECFQWWQKIPIPNPYFRLFKKFQICIQHRYFQSQHTLLALSVQAELVSKTLKCILMWRNMLQLTRVIEVKVTECRSHRVVWSHRVVFPHASLRVGGRWGTIKVCPSWMEGWPEVYRETSPPIIIAAAIWSIVAKPTISKAWLTVRGLGHINPFTAEAPNHP